MGGVHIEIKKKNNKIIQSYEFLSLKAFLAEPLSPKVYHCSADPTCRGDPQLV